MTATRELDLVELVSAAGAPAGTATVADAHTAPGLLHRAFSVLLFDPEGRILLQQRAAAKTRFPLRWANACCGHPAPDEPTTQAAGRRLSEELGVKDLPLTEMGVYTYRAADPATDRVEHEYDHVLVGRAPGDLALAPDPAEVADTQWVPAPALLADLRTGEPQNYAPWLLGVLEVAITRLPDIGLNSSLRPRESH